MQRTYARLRLPRCPHLLVAAGPVGPGPGVWFCRVASWLLVCGWAAVGWSEPPIPPRATDPASVRLIHPSTERWRIGVIVRARGTVTGIVATVPFPRDWPEQAVQVIDRQVSPQVKSARFRDLDDTARQLVVTIPRLNAGQEAQAVLTVEITRHDMVAPESTHGLVAPPTIPRALTRYLRPSPFVDSQDREIQQLAEQAVEGITDGWKRAETLYDLVRTKIEYRFDEQIKSARTALDDGFGDCEELSSLFIAMCRAVKIPARLVWVPGHCYPEFYLVDGQGQGHWYPCQAAGTRSFGAIAETRPILQKGDNFRVPGERQATRYVHETLKATNAAAPPEVQFVREPLGGNNATGGNSDPRTGLPLAPRKSPQ